MKPFVIAVVAMIVIAAGANVALNEMGWSSEDAYSSAPAVRLN